MAENLSEIESLAVRTVSYILSLMDRCPIEDRYLLVLRLLAKLRVEKRMLEEDPSLARLEHYFSQSSE